MEFLCEKWGVLPLGALFVGVVPRTLLVGVARLLVVVTTTFGECARLLELGCLPDIFYFLLNIFLIELVSYQLLNSAAFNQTDMLMQNGVEESGSDP